MTPATFFRVIAHELFHVVEPRQPRRGPLADARSARFVRAEGDRLPGELADRRITNPDDRRCTRTINVQFDGKPAAVFLAIMASKDL